MTLKALRERTKKACHAARQVHGGVTMKPRFGGMNMRQAWVENAKVIGPLLATENLTWTPDGRLVDFHREGEIYYHAKEHGLQSAMMLKLSRS